MKHLYLLALLAAFGLAESATRADEDRGSRGLIITSTTQTADFASQVVGDRWDVQCVLEPGQDPHLYQITSDDAQLVAKADLCVENGWKLEGKQWMRTLAEDNGKRLVTCTTGIQPYELEEKGGTIPDPHAWFSPQNAAIYIKNIEKAVSEVDPKHREEYQARTELYLRQLRTLHRWIVAQVNAIPANRRVLVTSHDAFNYFCNQYQFKSAAPAGWSTQDLEAGITAESRRETVKSIKRFGVKAIFVETSVNKTLIREIAKESGVQVGGALYSDSMGRPGSAGESYLGMMRENVLTIVQALK